jgi:uncharacterized membrane protein
MDFPSQLVPASVLWLANLLMLLVAIKAVRQASLSRLFNNEFLHVFLASCVVLLLFWNTGVGVLPALNFHLLGVTAITLMFGWAYAVIAVVLVVSGTIINQGDVWIGIGLNSLVMGFVPIAVTEFMLRFAQRKLMHNFFVYVYVNGFLAAGLSMVAAGLVGGLVMLLVDSTSAEWLVTQYYPYLPLLFFSEAFINGMLMTGLVAMRPGWVCSFDDDLYLNNK